MKKILLSLLMLSIFIPAQTSSVPDATETVNTVSNNSSIGTINVYFNLAVDTSIAMVGNAAKGKVNLETALVTRINQATYSIDFAVYSFNGYDNITNALIYAKNRGVKLRMVYDSRAGSGTQSSVTALLNAGVLVSRRPSLLVGTMHNKFFLFDARDTNTANDWVWTGSWNMNTAETQWKNNVIEINDPALSAAYQAEFEEMWGSKTDIPNTANAKFGNQKTNNTLHDFTIGGRSVHLYFSPTDNTNARINDALNTADKSIHLGLYVFAKNDLAQTIQTRYLAGVTDLKGIINDVNATGSVFNFLRGFSGDIYQNVFDTLYSKYGLIDASYPSSSPMVITGSHDWSSASEISNDDNTLIINDLKIANQYLQDFKKRYNELGGRGVFAIPNVTPSDTCKSISLNANWNMVSLPVLPANTSAAAVFPLATSQVYAFSNGYMSQTNLTAGRGCWVRYPAAANIQVCGVPASGGVPLIAGWNMIGVHNITVPVSGLTTTPAGILNSNFYGFNNGYTQAANLEPGKGYWIRASQAGTLNLPASAVKSGTE